MEWDSRCITAIVGPMLLYQICLYQNTNVMYFPCTQNLYYTVAHCSNQSVPSAADLVCSMQWIENGMGLCKWNFSSPRLGLLGPLSNIGYLQINCKINLGSTFAYFPTTLPFFHIKLVLLNDSQTESWTLVYDETYDILNTTWNRLMKGQALLVGLGGIHSKWQFMLAWHT